MHCSTAGWSQSLALDQLLYMCLCTSKTDSNLVSHASAYLVVASLCSENGDRNILLLEAESMKRYSLVGHERGSASVATCCSVRDIASLSVCSVRFCCIPMNLPFAHVVDGTCRRTLGHFFVRNASLFHFVFPSIALSRIIGHPWCEEGRIVNLFSRAEQSAWPFDV